MKLKVMFPQEIEVWYVLPAIRREFAHELVSAGMSQKNVAKLLGITEAAVSQYKKYKRAKLQFEDHVKQRIREAAARIIEHPQRVFEEILCINQYVKHTGEFCRIHKIKSETPIGCQEVCQKHFFGK